MDLTASQSIVPFMQSVRIIIERAFSKQVSDQERLREVLPLLIAKYNKLLGLIPPFVQFDRLKENQLRESVEANRNTLEVFHAMVYGKGSYISDRDEKRIIRFLELIKADPTIVPPRKKYMFNLFG